MACKGNRAGPAYGYGAIRTTLTNASTIGTLQTINIDGLSSNFSDGNFGRHMQIGVVRSNTEGDPATPSLQLKIPGFWRFRWVVKTGVRSIRINVKQEANLTPRPSMVVKANAAVGLAADSTAVAASANGWVTIGPVTFTATATGAIWVELWNNCVQQPDTPCYFDHIVAT